jgi:hypothetical protein
MDPLPIPGRRSFLAATKREWEAWFTSGAADDWDEAQVAHAERTIVLIDMLNREQSASDRIKIDQSVRQALRVLNLTKRDDEDSEEAIAAQKAQAQALWAEQGRISRERQAIRNGVELHELHRGWRDREGNWCEGRDALFTDEWPDPALEDERQAQAEASNQWPDVSAGIPSSEGTNAKGE